MIRYVLVLSVLCASAGCEAPPLPPVSVDEVVASERAFSAAAAEEGYGMALRIWLADRSIVLAPTPVDGQAWLTHRVDSGYTMQWWPRFADIAGTGDLGYTLGPWTARDPAGSMVDQGHYVSVWRKASDGWRVEVMARISHEAYSRLVPAHVATSNTPGWIRARRKLYQEAARVSMLKADHDLARASMDQGSARAFQGLLADSVMLFRDNVLPQQGVTAMMDMLVQEEGILTWVPVDGAISMGGDLGYTYGIQTVRPLPPDTMLQSRAYLRLWKSQPDSTWHIVANIIMPEVHDTVSAVMAVPDGH